MKMLGAAALVCATLITSITLGVLFAGAFLVVYSYIPAPEGPGQIVYVTSEAEIRVVTATPEPATPAPAITQQVLIITATPEPTGTPGFQADLATAYPMATPLRIYPTATAYKGPPKVEYYGDVACFGGH